MNEIFGKLAMSGIMGIVVWFVSFLLYTPMADAIEALNERIANVLFALYVCLLPTSIIIGLIGAIGYIWTY